MMVLFLRLSRNESERRAKSHVFSPEPPVHNHAESSSSTMHAAAAAGCPFAAGLLGLMPRLKKDTQALHDAAEHHPFQRTMFKGRLPIEAYTAWLGQMYLVHSSLETGLIGARSRVPAIDAVVTDEQLQVPYLLDDLAHFNIDPATIQPEPATSRLAERLSLLGKDQPLALLGHHYVLEGSNNGGKYIAMSLRKSYGLQPGHGDKYLDPYGPQQTQVWAAFKDAMTAQRFSNDEQDTLVNAAAEMFDAIRALSDDLWTRFASTIPNAEQIAAEITAEPKPAHNHNATATSASAH